VTTDRGASGHGSLRGLLSSSSRPPIGLFVKIPAPEVVEMVATVGYDFVIIDTEHALLSVRDVYAMAVLYASLGVHPLVRLPDHGYGDAQRYLDAGVDGLLFPHVNDAAEARTIATHLTFPPAGTRGMGFGSRAGRWGLLEGGREEYLRFGDEEVLRVAMVEEAGAVEAVEAIASVPGIDAVFVGPSDLALSMGRDAAPDTVATMVDRAIEAAIAAGTPVGTIASSPDAAKRRADQGCSFLVAGNDTGVLARALKRSVDDIRAGLAARP